MSKYMKNRNYLSGFYSELRRLEKLNIVKIIEIKRIPAGSFFVESYSLVAWKVL